MHKYIDTLDRYFKKLDTYKKLDLYNDTGKYQNLKLKYLYLFPL